MTVTRARSVLRDLAMVASIGPLAALTGCGLTRETGGGPPVVEVRTPNGTELGVNTTVGVVFQGRTAQAGPCQVTAFIGHTPVVEDGVIEPVNGGLFTTRIVIQTPTAQLLPDHPRPDEQMILMGIRGGQVYTQDVVLTRDDGITGNVLRMPFNFTPDQVGAPILVVRDGFYYLVGIVKATATLEAGGITTHFLAYSGLEQFREYMLQRRPAVAEREVIYRDDEIRTVRERR